MAANAAAQWLGAILLSAVLAGLAAIFAWATFYGVLLTAGKRNPNRAASFKTIIQVCVCVCV